MNSTAVRIDYFSAIQRQKAKVRQLNKRLRDVTAELDAAEIELDRLREADAKAGAV